MVGGRVMVGGGDHAVDAPEFAPRHFQALKGLRTGNFVHQMAVDVEQHRAVFFFADDVAVPEFVVEGLRCGVHDFVLGIQGKTAAILAANVPLRKQNV